jgi:hypothetical protein
MMLGHFQEVWLYDFEFGEKPGEHPEPRCLVAKELHSGKLLKIWEDELLQMKHPPYHTGSTSVFVSYYACAEHKCHLSLGWPLPERIIDLYAEFRCISNTRPKPPAGLLDALDYFGIAHIGSADKDRMRELAIKGGPWSPQAKRELFDYCESDVLALEKLLPMILPKVNLRWALLRGRFTRAEAMMIQTGIPLDTATWDSLNTHWVSIRKYLVEKIDGDYGVFEGLSFNTKRFAAYLARNQIPWPRLESGELDLKDSTFKTMSLAYPQINALRELRHTLGQLKLNKLTVGSDGRNRLPMLSSFSTITGRNAPSNSKSVFGPSCWIRSLIKPPPEYGLFYSDWSQQEFAVGACLSGDENMIEAYETKDPYMALAIRANAAPINATKQTHGEIRNLYKAVTLGVNYGMGVRALSRRINKSELVARNLLADYKAIYSVFWKWSEAIINHAMWTGQLSTVFDWRFHIGTDINPRSIKNYIIQGAAADMMRLAASILVERGVRVCAVVHDAFLIEAPLGELEEAIQITQEAMAEASRELLGGFAIRTDVYRIPFPERYVDERGIAVWDLVLECLRHIGCESAT